MYHTYLLSQFPSIDSHNQTSTMKLSSISISFLALVALSNAQDPPMLRGLGRGGGGGGGGGRGGGGGGGGGGGRGGGGGKGGRDKGGRGKGGRGKGEMDSIFSMLKGNCYWGADDSKPLLDRLQEECNSSDYCEANPSCDDPKWKTMDDDGLMVDGCPEGGLTDEQKEELKDKMEAKHEEMKAMSDEDREAYREERKANKAANADTVLGCGCCSGDSGIESVKSLVNGKEGAVAKALDFRKPKVDGEGGGHGSGMDIESMLAAKCPAFKAEDGCTNMEADADGEVDCSQFDSMKRGRKMGPKMLYCGCGCRDDTGGD